MNEGSLERLTAEGVSLWLDGFGREQLVSGGFSCLLREKRVTGAVYGITRLLNAVGGRWYERQLADLAARGVEPSEALRALIAHDLRRACDLLLPVHQADSCCDGLVSVELPPVPAGAVLAESRSLWWTVDRPNLLVRIPPTPDRLAVITACLAEGISVDVGPLFSLQRYAQVLDAFFEGLEQAQAAGRDLSAISSVASFPLGPLDAAVARRLNDRGACEVEALRHTACLATARLAYQLQDQRFTDERWRPLAASGARPQRLLWTATSAAGPADPDTRHVDGMVAWGVISAVSEETLDAVADHALLAGDTLSGRQVSARRDLTALAELGVDLAELTRELEEEAERAVTAPWEKLVALVGEELQLRRA